MIVVCGEALIDLVEIGDGTYRALPGGSPANVAVGIARLDAPVALLARVSTDTFGGTLMHHLRANRVRDRYIVRSAAPSTLAVASLDEQARADYSFYLSGTADWQWSADELPDTFDSEVRILHSGSLALAVPPGAQVLEGLMRRERSRGKLLVSYDPNVRRRLEPDAERARDRVERQLALAHVVKASSDDLIAVYPRTDPLEVVHEWLARGPDLVVVTRGADGAIAATRTHIVSRPAPQVVPVDTVGAGDAFTAALLAEIAALRVRAGGSLSEAVRQLPADALAALVDFAVAAASLTCTRSGADPPSRDELLRWRAGP